MTADSNITVVPPPTRAPSATVSSPTADFTQSEVNPSYPTAKSAHGREIDQKKVERLVWECYNSQMAASESERVSKGTPQTQQTLDEDYDLVSQTLPVFHWSYSKSE
jgi:hypothetical protein